MSKTVRDTLDSQGKRITIVDYICDGCGETQIGDDNGKGAWDKPRLWYARTVDIGTPNEHIVHVCQRACIERAEQALGIGSSWVIPGSLLGLE
jgi:hypothetical protein